MESKWKTGVLTAALILFAMSNVYAGPKDGTRRGRRSRPHSPRLADQHRRNARGRLCKLRGLQHLPASGRTWRDGRELHSHQHFPAVGFLPRTDGPRDRRHAQNGRRVLRRRLRSRSGAAARPRPATDLPAAPASRESSTERRRNMKKATKSTRPSSMAAARYSTHRRRRTIHRSQQAGARSIQRLQPRLPLELRPHQHHLRRDPQGGRLHGLVRQAPRLRRGFRADRNFQPQQRGRLLLAGSQFQSDSPAGHHHRRNEIRLLRDRRQRQTTGRPISRPSSATTS